MVSPGGIRPADPFLIELNLLDEYCCQFACKLLFLINCYFILIRFGEFISGFFCFYYLQLISAGTQLYLTQSNKLIGLIMYFKRIVVSCIFYLFLADPNSSFIL